MLRDEAYVPFDIAFSDEEGAAKVITGPNMAGESVFRAVAGTDQQAKVPVSAQLSVHEIKGETS